MEVLSTVNDTQTVSGKLIFFYKKLFYFGTKEFVNLIKVSALSAVFLAKF